MPDQKTLGESIRLRMKHLEEVKQDYDARDLDIAKYVNPRRELLRDSQRYDNKGGARGKQAFTGEPANALNIWATGMQGHMVSQSLRWFKNIVSIPALNQVDEVKKYLQKYDEAMYGEYNNSNFYAILPEWFRDAGSIGTASLYTEEDIGRKVATHTVIHPREVFIAEDVYGNVDTVFRKFFLTAKQAVDKFDKPGDKLSQTIKDNAEDHPEKRHEFIHAVFYNTDRMFGSLLSKDKQYASIYVEMTIDATNLDGTVRESGFDINPYAVWRLRKNSDEIYGYSPAADAMVSIKKLNQMSRTLLKMAQMAAESPLNIPEHMRGHTQIKPDGHNYFERGGDKISAINTGSQYPIAIDREDKVRQIIEDAYGVDFFLVLQRAEREMTATEILERQAEKSVILGPQVDSLEREGLTKANDNVHVIADGAGRLPPPPQILVDAEEEAKESGQRPVRINMRLIGPLAQAQRRLFQMQPIENGLNKLGQAAVLYPKVLDKIDPDRLAEKILDTTDFPQDVMRTDPELKEYRDKQELEQQQAQAMQIAQGAADAYPKLAKKPEEGSPAEAIGEAIGA